MSQYPSFDLPPVDHLIEGMDYFVVEFDFAEVIEHTPGQPCPEGTKMIFGLCRRLKGDKWDQDDPTKSEQNAKRIADAQGSNQGNNKQISAEGRKLGWAMRDKKPVLVEWGSVAGIKKVGPKIVGPKSRRGSSSRDPNSIEGQIKGLRDAQRKQTNQAGFDAIQQQIDNLSSGSGIR